jgi:hypothetical protein
MEFADSACNIAAGQKKDRIVSCNRQQLQALILPYLLDYLPPFLSAQKGYKITFFNMQ